MLQPAFSKSRASGIRTKKKIRHSINNSGKLGLFGWHVCYDLLMVAFGYPSTRHTYQRALDSKTSTTTSTRFSVLSSARVVILAGKRESRRHSNRSFRENVVVAKTSYHLLGILSFRDRDHSGGEKKKAQ